MSLPNIPLFKVRTPPEVGAVVQRVFDSGVIAEGKYVADFEKAFGEKFGNPNVVMVNAGTSALALAAYLIGIKPGSEIVASPMSCFASFAPFFSAGAKFVWADVDQTTGNISPEDVARKVTPKTKAVLAVHWAGQPFDHDAVWSAVGGRIPIVADAAHALGAEYKGRPIATVGHAVIFSFQAIKHLTTGDGGALALNSSPGYECEVETVVKGVDAQVVATRARKLRWFGLDRNYTGGSKWEQDIPECGFKFHANNIAAAIGHAQLDHIDTILWRHRQNSARYDKEITNPRVEKLRRPSNVVSSAWVYSLLVEDPKGFQAHMQGKGIASDVVHMRCDRYSVFKDFAVPAGSLPGLDHFGSRLMNVPVGWWLSEDDASRVIDAVNAWRP